MDWKTLYDIAAAREKDYLGYLNNKFSKQYFQGQTFSSLREALDTIFANNYKGNEFVPDKKKTQSSDYVRSTLKGIVEQAYNVYFSNQKRIADYIISMLPWTTDNGNYPQKLSQMYNAKSEEMRAGYFNEIVITENIIHSLISQYPGIDFKVDVKNYGKGDFTLYLTGQSNQTNDKTKIPHIPFDAKSNLNFFYIQSMEDLSQKVQKEIKKTLGVYMLNERIETTDYTPKEMTDIKSPYYSSSEERGNVITYIRYDLPTDKVDSCVLYQLLYNLLTTKVPVFVTTNGSIPEFVLATELIESKMDFKSGYFIELRSDKPQKTYTTDTDTKKAKDALLKQYLKEINNLKIIGGKR